MAGTVKVHAPVEGFNGTVAGVDFTDGHGEVERDNRSALAYFARHGYGLGGAPEASEAPEPPDPRRVGFLGSGIEPVGTRLRDAAVDPRPEDFLPPTNAGEANPHGPEVVAPELHGSGGVRPVKPGPVPDEPDVQDAAEQSHTEEATDVEAEHSVPAKSASKAEWVAHAVAHGMDPDLAEKATKADLVKVYGGEG